MADSKRGEIVKTVTGTRTSTCIPVSTLYKCDQINMARNSYTVSYIPNSRIYIPGKQQESKAKCK